MPAVQATLEFLAKIPLYDTEKPYLYLPGKDEKLDPDQTRLDNMEYELHPDILIKDIREQPSLTLDKCGFEYVTHPFPCESLETRQEISKYCSEMERLLAERFQAERVVTYEHRLRKNELVRRTEFDVYDPLLVEGPAKGAHNGKVAFTRISCTTDSDEMSHTPPDQSSSTDICQKQTRHSISVLVIVSKFSSETTRVSCISTMLILP